MQAGYVNLVGLKGGFYAWYRLWDNNLRRRRSGEYAESYLHDGDSCGIHSSGAGFDKGACRPGGTRARARARPAALFLFRAISWLLRGVRRWPRVLLSLPTLLP